MPKKKSNTYKITIQSPDGEKTVFECLSISMSYSADINPMYCWGRPFYPKEYFANITIDGKMFISEGAKKKKSKKEILNDN